MHIHVCVLHGTLDWTLWLCREADEISTPRVGQIREHLTRLDTTQLEAAIGTPTATPSDTLQHVFCKQISLVCAMSLSISMDISWHSQIRLMLHVTPLCVRERMKLHSTSEWPRTHTWDFQGRWPAPWSMCTTHVLLDACMQPKPWSSMNTSSFTPLRLSCHALATAGFKLPSLTYSDWIWG